MVRFAVAPREDGVSDFRIGSIVKAALWYFVIHISVTLVYHFADLMLFGETLDTGIGNAVQTLPLWVVLVLPPVLEETAFRLPLRRKRHYLALSSAAIMFLASAPLFSVRVYDIGWERLLLSAVFAFVVWSWGWRWIQRLDFKTWLWTLVLCFSFLHIVNYDLGAMDACGWIRVLLKEAVKIPGALIFSYVRIRHGFGISVALHFFINFFAYFLSSWL